MKERWEILKLCDLIESNVIGLTKNSSEQDVHHQFKYVKMNNITRDNRFDLSKYTRVNAKKEDLEKYSLSEGDFLFNTRNSYELVGKTCLFEGYKNEVILYNNNIMRIRFLKNINPFFINYAFSTDDLIKKLDRLKSGTTNVSAIYYKDLKSLELLVPPLPEQQRIVAILDEAFAAIAKAKANALQNLQNAKELFECYLQGVFEYKGEDWVEKTLGEVCNVIGGGTPSKANNKFYDGEIYWATVRDMKGEIIFDTEHKITRDAVKNSSTNIIPKGNVIIATRVGLGKVCLIANDTAINQDLRGVVPISDKKLSVDFLFRWFKSISHKIVEEGTGATVQGVKLPFIKSLTIYLPPLKTQQTIVQKLDALSAETKKLENIYQQKINDLEELKKSVLQKAFAGELKTDKAIAV